MSSMTHLLLLSAIIASVYLPAHADETSTDYEYGDDGDESSRPPGRLEKATAAPLMPYFKEGQVVLYVNRSAERVKLDCPVQNYQALHHAIMWYQDETAVTNGNQSMVKGYSMDNQFALTIPVENATSYNYSCRIIPSGVRRNITVQFQTTNGAPSSSWPTALECIILSALALFQQGTTHF